MDQADENVTITENLAVSSGALTKEDTVTHVTKESNQDESDKRKRNMKDKTGNEMSKTTNVDAKEGKVVPADAKKGLKRKADHPSTSEMVLDSIKTLRKRNGATFDDIGKYMEEKYSVSMKTLKSHINKFLKKSVDNGVLEKIESDDAEGKFKIKKSEDIKKSSKSLLGKEGKAVSVSKRKDLKRKAEHPPTSEMVLDSIKALRKRNGATFESIGKYMEEKYSVSMKTLKLHINKFLKKSVDDGVLEKIDGTGAEAKFKIKKSEDTKRSSKNVIGKEGKGKPVKKMITTKQKIKK